MDVTTAKGIMMVLTAYWEEYESNFMSETEMLTLFAKYGKVANKILDKMQDKI